MRGLLVLAVLLATLAGERAAAQTPDAAALAALLKARIEQLRAGAVHVSGARLRRTEEVAAFYEARRFAAVWNDAADRSALLALIDGVAADGLTPAHYHRAAIARRAGTTRDPGDAVDLELLGTDALAQIAHDLRNGRTRVAERAISPPAPPGDGALGAVIDDVRALGGEAALHRLRPRQFVYTGLMDALARLRVVEATGGWAPIPAGRALRVDSTDARVPALRTRLVLEGDLAAPPAGTASSLFDAALERAVRAFQHRHGLNEDGVVGPATRAQLNVPVARRIVQVRVNLERARWLADALPPTFIAVNAAGAKVYMVRAGEVVLEKRAIVGQAYTRTPVFTAPMRYIDLNPTWTVPPGIVGEVLSAIRRNPGWLGRENMQVLDRSGRLIDPRRIDFFRYSARSFPYTFRQAPGPRNPLGTIKFLFPNRHNVYLHDTPARALFEQEQRLFSHGCIRIQDPLDLALLVLDGTGWTRAALDSAIAAGATRTITLPAPIPVFVLYWTASADLHGELHFYPDVYGRDEEVERQLENAELVNW